MQNIKENQKNTNEQKNKITKINMDCIPWKIIMQNTEGLATENSKVGIETMREYANNE